MDGMNRIRVYCDITMTRQIDIEVPEDASREETLNAIDAVASKAFDEFMAEVMGKFDGWYWGGENVETESI